MLNANDRKSSYKLPPAAARTTSQETRRSKALEDQKRKRAQRIESTRQLDLFANLSINDETDDEPIEEHDRETSAAGAVGPYVAMLKASEQDLPMETENAMISSPIVSPEVTVSAEQNGVKKRRKKHKKNANYNKPSKWADQCMYAELLEMTAEDPIWSSAQNSDGLPEDLETGWVAVAPVPVGKRCLVVTHQTAGLGGMVPNTTIRSRLLGKSLIARFPSPLPALTVLDCILDANWRSNGIIHVLDVIRWKGQDVGDCEAPFRFWWRDTRLGELSRTLPPNISFRPNKEGGTRDAFQFPYPAYFLPVPYHTNTTLASLDADVIPAARSIRSIAVDVPSATPSADIGSTTSSPTFQFGTSRPPAMTLSPSSAAIQSDGLLLYVSEASYEPGTSPLSNWVPIRSDNVETPLDLFHKLVKRRLVRASGSDGRGVDTVEEDVSMDL